MNSLLWKLGAFNIAGCIAAKAAGGHKPWDEKRKGTFSSVTQLHLVNGIGLMLASFQKTSGLLGLTSLLLLLGTGLFCGAGYYRCFTDKTNYNFLMPVGGSSMIVGWLLMAFI
jgi:uncharacterized membrane protein YgdD (TMEM256/DUF423 family)